jgi:hypothetical protein
VHLAYQRHLLQVGAVDRELGRLLSRLRETGLYDRALVIVAADHGISFLVGQRDRRVVRRFNVQDIAPVPLFVKRPGQRHGRISRAYARTYDILPTIADVLHVRVPWRTAGRSVFSSALRRRRTIRLVGRNRFERVVRLSTADFQRRWRGAIRRRQLLFGSGLARPGLYRVGPRADLIGRRTEGLPIAPPGAPHALVNGAAELRHVDLGSDYRPVLVSGRISNGAPRARRDIAIAINGRIEAVTRSFYLRGSHKESFACLVPEDALLATNRVQVLAVSGERRGLRLQLLGAV